MSSGNLVFQVRIFVEEEDEGFYAFCPDLSCIHVYGDSEDEALNSAKDAVLVYLDMSLKHGDPIPIGIRRDAEVVQHERTRPRKTVARPQEFVEDLRLAMA